MAGPRIADRSAWAVSERVNVSAKRRRNSRAVPGLFALLLLGGCAGTQVRALATDSGQGAYDLRGTDLGALSAEANRLCPQGHAVLRQWQSSGQLAGVNAESVSANEFAWSISYDVARPQAQMSVVCKA